MRKQITNFRKGLTIIVIKVWCLSSEQNEKDLNLLHKTIVKAVVSVSELCVKDENDMVCLFPPDLMTYGPGQEIIIEIDGIPDVPRKSLTVREQLARYVGENVLTLYPKARIECSVREFNPSNGRWSSVEPRD